MKFTYLQKCTFKLYSGGRHFIESALFYLIYIIDFYAVRIPSQLIA